MPAIQLQVKAAHYDKLLLLRNMKAKHPRSAECAHHKPESETQHLQAPVSIDFTEGTLDEEEYAAKKAYDEQYVDLSRRLDSGSAEGKVCRGNVRGQQVAHADEIRQRCKMLSHELVDESVELVKVHEDCSIELVMKYGDIYALTVQCIKEVQEAM